VAEWEDEPLTAWAVIVKFPVAAFGLAPRTTTAFAPAAIVKGLAGFKITPLGVPASDTATVPVKPFMAATEMVMGALVAPCAIETEADENVIAKSGEGGGGGCTLADGLPPPLHPAHMSSETETTLLHACLCKSATLRLTPRDLG
jgi:hypothetical protein